MEGKRGEGNENEDMTLEKRREQSRGDRNKRRKEIKNSSELMMTKRRRGEMSLIVTIRLIKRVALCNCSPSSLTSFTALCSAL